MKPGSEWTFVNPTKGSGMENDKKEEKRTAGKILNRRLFCYTRHDIMGRIQSFAHTKGLTFFPL